MLPSTHDTPIGVGIVGYGFAGRGFHAYLIDQEPRLQLRAVFVRNEERRQRAADDRPIILCESFEEMLASKEINLVVLATPHDVHASQAIQAMDAGKHVVTDKIIALTAAEARAMAEAAERNNVVLSVFHNRRWDGDFLTIQEIWKSGLIGDVYAAECCILRYGPPGGWRAQKARSGGLMFDWGAHMVDQALLLCGQPETVTCTILDRGAWPGVDIGNYGRITLQFAGGLMYTVEFSHLARIQKPHWYVLGTKGALRKDGVDPQEPAMLAGNITAAREDPANYAQVYATINGIPSDMRMETRRGDWRECYKNIAMAIRGEAPLAITPQQMVRLMTVYDAAMLSAAEGRTVRFDETP